MTTRIYHNPRCSKSRQTLKLLEEHGIEAEVIHYLETPPGIDELRGLVDALSLPVAQIVRTGESTFKDMKLDIDEMNDTSVFEAIASNPILLQRPIVVVGNRAAIGRPPESVLTLFDDLDARESETR